MADEKSLEIRDDGWLTDDETTEHSPGYLEALERFNAVIMRMRETGVSETAIANCLFNLHARQIASMNPTDAQVTQVTTMFAIAVKSLRDNDPRAYYVVQL